MKPSYCIGCKLSLHSVRHTHFQMLHMGASFLDILCTRYIRFHRNLSTSPLLYQCCHQGRLGSKVHRADIYTFRTLGPSLGRIPQFDTGTSNSSQMYSDKCVCSLTFVGCSYLKGTLPTGSHCTVLERIYILFFLAV